MIAPMWFLYHSFVMKHPLRRLITHTWSVANEAVLDLGLLLEHLTNFKLLITYLSTSEHTICNYIQVYLLTCGLVQNVLCFLSSYYETSLVIFLNLICGRLQGIPCKQTISKHYCFKSLCHFLKILTFTFFMLSRYKKYHVTLFLYFSLSIGNLDWKLFTDT